MIYIDKMKVGCASDKDDDVLVQRHIIYILMQHMNNSRKLMLSFTGLSPEQIIAGIDMIK